ncbi:hypothetical protein C1H46_034748 [Malus baccata]|uniref:Protein DETOXIFICATION n=1 Tax=Malus baccata TaxID=106549 RepID=A0A540KZS6_MALBA|nr:hypothetical protein C1H46_034748 [Malus baccata]
MPLVFFSVIPLALHVLVVYGLVHWTTLGFRGAPLAASILIWISMIMLATYVKRAKKFERTWEGFSFESFHYVLMDLKLALPFAAMVCVLGGSDAKCEYRGNCIHDYIWPERCCKAGRTINPGLFLSLQVFQHLHSVSPSETSITVLVSTRVSNELGAGNPDKAKKAMVVTLKLSVLLAFLVDLALAVGHNLWAGLFSDSRAIIKLFAYMTPFLAISVLADSVQGVARGCGWQHLAVYVNLGTFYLIRMTIAGDAEKIEYGALRPAYLERYIGMLRLVMIGKITSNYQEQG